MRSYKQVASLVNDGRMAGLIDWDAIEDRTREFIQRPRWRSGSDILRAVAQQFHMDMWEGQEYRVFVIVEKEALVGVLERTCTEYDVPLLAARGYPSASVLREFFDSEVANAYHGRQEIVILHLGDHDPSGLDMTRDIQDRGDVFGRDDGVDFTLQRIALNMSQVEELKPPPNPAKTTDARFDAYRRRFGTRSWELDALPPDYLVRLLSRQIERRIDDDLWQERKDKIEAIKSKIEKVADKFKD
jgi:hypothetical protein